MQDLKTRVITAIFLGIFIIGGILYRVESYALVLVVIAFFSSYEYIKLASFGAEISQPKVVTVCAAFTAIIPLMMYMAGAFFQWTESFLISVLTGMILSGFLFLYFLFKNEIGDWRMYQAYTMALIYIGLPSMLFYWVSAVNQTYDWWKPLSLLILIWSNDTMAYFTGRFIGKKPLYSAISPKKTIEGFVGGLICTVFAGLVLSYFIHHMNPVQWVIYGFGISLLSTGGDLFESMIKRRFGVKDSGTLLPGHGGFLDRFDAFIFVLPIATVYLYLCWK